jgi:hypothetical protein
MIYENIIIGSGPTAVTIANQLLKLNKKVTIIDIGNTIEKKNLNIKNEYLKTKNKKTFLKSIKKNKILNNYKNPHLKFPFGSEFVFQKNSYEQFTAPENLDYILSNAYGGLSNIWGTMVSPFFHKDIENWDIKYSDYYKNKSDVEEIIPVSSSNDNLQDFFGINFGKAHQFNLSNPAKIFLNNLLNRKKLLNNNGLFFGRSKVAVGNYYSNNNIQCQECGLCHYGCPYDCMFNSSQLFDLHKNNKNFTYIKNKFAKKINYSHKSNFLECIDINTKEEVSFLFKNIFLCCGPISTAALLFRSNLVKSDKVVFKESQRFFLPIFNKKNIKDSTSQNKNVLSELYLEIYDEKLLSKSVHFQYYTFIDIFLKPLEKFFGNYVYLFPKIFPFIFGRLNLLIGYLHSDYSNKIIMTSSPNQESKKYQYSLSFEKNNLINDSIKKITSYLKENLKEDFYISNRLTNINLTGASYHYGSSFPMSNFKNSLKDQTSLNGELNNNKNIFLLDASILPDMPGHPTTFNVCVNAARIIKNLNKEGRI